jgi:hypothetical protein
VDWTDLRIGTCCGLSRKGYVTFGCDKIRGISWLAEELLAFQQGLLLRGVNFVISVGNIEVFLANHQLIHVQSARYVIDSCCLMNVKVESILLLI